MSLVRRGKKGLFSLVIDDYSSGRRRRRFVALGTTLKREADAKRIEILAQLKGQSPPQAGRMTLAEWLEIWVVSKESIPLAPYTITEYRRLITNHIVPALGGERLASLRPDQIERFYASLHGSVPIHCHNLLNIALREAVRRDLISRNPLDRVAKPRHTPAEHIILTREEARQLLNFLTTHRLRPLFMLALSTGMRRGELIGLRWVDVDFEHGVINVRVQRQYQPGQGVIERVTKEHRGARPIEMTDVDRAILQEQRIRQDEERELAGAAWQEHDLVFPSEVGTPLNPRNLNRVFSRQLELAGLRHVRLHDLRHMAATFLIQDSEGDTTAVQVRLGHAMVTTTLRIYVHNQPGRQKKVADRTAASLFADATGPHAKPTGHTGAGSPK